MMTMAELLAKCPKIIETRNKFGILIKSDVILHSLDILLYRLSIVRHFYGKSMIVNSGYRDPEYNQKVGGAKWSNHQYGLAVDIADPERKLWDWINVNMVLMDDFYE